MIKPQHSSIKLYYNSDSPGFVGAIKLGISKSNAPVVVIMMADGSDDPQSIPSLVTLVESGFGIGSASRYISGGAQLGGPVIKKFLSRLAGVTFQYFTGCGTNDPTNNFKAYSKAFLLQTTIESKKGFEVGIELVSKAGKTKLAIGEVPTVWIDRSFGDSKFTLIKSFPYYLRWYLYGIINIRN
jgi:hypothetical protein